MAVINISKRGESNFKRARGTLTQIADIAAPAEMLPRLDQCRVLVRTGIRLQAVRSMHKDDHCCWVIAVVLVFPRREKEREKSRHGPQIPLTHAGPLDGTDRCGVGAYEEQDEVRLPRSHRVDGQCDQWRLHQDRDERDEVLCCQKTGGRRGMGGQKLGTSVEASKAKTKERKRMKQKGYDHENTDSRAKTQGERQSNWGNATFCYQSQPCKEKTRERQTMSLRRATRRLLDCREIKRNLVRKITMHQAVPDWRQ